MKIQKNSRQVPKNKTIVAQKYYSDILYGYLQVNSSRNEITGERYIEKTKTKYTELASLLGISRQTVSKKFNKLMELGLIIQDTENSKRLILPTLKPVDSFLVPNDTLRIMTNTLSDNTINVYTYLINRYYANKEQPYDFTIHALKNYCGLGTESSTNNYIINDILQVLQKLGLIKYTVSKQKTGNDIKSYHHLISASLTCC